MKVRTKLVNHIARFREGTEFTTYEVTRGMSSRECTAASAYLDAWAHDGYLKRTAPRKQQFVVLAAFFGSEGLASVLQLVEQPRVAVAASIERMVAAAGEVEPLGVDTTPVTLLGEPRAAKPFVQREITGSLFRHFAVYNAQNREAIPQAVLPYVLQEQGIDRSAAREPTLSIGLAHDCKALADAGLLNYRSISATVALSGLGWETLWAKAEVTTPPARDDGRSAELLLLRNPLIAKLVDAWAKALRDAYDNKFRKAVDA